MDSAIWLGIGGFILVVIVCMAFPLYDSYLKRPYDRGADFIERLANEESIAKRILFYVIVVIFLALVGMAGVLFGLMFGVKPGI